MYRSHYNPGPYDDDWEDQPGQGPFYQWGCGVVLPAMILCYGVVVLYSHTGELVNSRSSMTLHGRAADAYGVALVAAAVFVHCHYFWGNIYNEIWFAVLGKILSAAAFIGSLVYLCIHLGIFGLNR